MQQLPPQHATSPDIRRDRSVPQNPYAGSQPILHPASQPSQQIQPQPPQSFGRPPVAPATAPRTPVTGGLSRLNTGEIQSQPLPSAPTVQPGSQQLHPLSQSQSANEAQHSSSPSGPGLFFHHWTPPSTANANSTMPPTPSGSSQKASPSFQPNQSSHLRSEYQNSPKKRKGTGSQQQGPPTSQPSHTSPSFSARSSREREISPNNPLKRRHSRQRSSEGSSTRGYDAQNVARPSSRQLRHEESSGAGERHLKRHATESSGTSASGDERPMRYGPPQPETLQSDFATGPEMREMPPKREHEP